MRICLVTEYFYPDNTGGTPTLLSDLTRFLKDNYEDLEIDVVTSRNLYRLAGGKLASFEDWNGVRIHRLTVPRSNRPSTALRLAAGAGFAAAALPRLLCLGRYDLVIVGTNPPAAPAAVRAYGKLRRVPYVYLIHDLYPDLPMALGMLSKRGLPARMGRSMQHKWLHGAERVIVLGRCMKDHLARTYSLPPERIDVIPNWADPELIRPMPKQSEFRAERGLDGFVVLYAGNFGQFQGFTDIIDAARLVQDAGRRDITFALVGGGIRNDELNSYIAGQRVENVRVFPSVTPEHYPDLLASADVALVPLEAGLDGLAVPSKFYGILSAGRPTVAVLGAESEVSRVLREHDCGSQVDPGDAERLAQVVMRMADEPGTVERMGTNARAALVDNFTLRHAAERFRKSFVSALLS